MSFFRKPKKSRPLLQSQASGSPSRIGDIVSLEIPGPDTVSEGPFRSSEARRDGVNPTIAADLIDGRDSQVALLGHRGGQSYPSDAPTSTTAVTAVHEREREQEVSSNVLDERITPDVPDLPPTEREPEDLDRRGHEDQGTFPKRSIEVPPEPASEDYPIGQDSLGPTREPGEYGVPGRESGNAALEVSADSSNIPKEAIDKFGPLQDILRDVSDVYAGGKETIHIGNEAEVLISRVAALEKHFYSCPTDVQEQRHRNEVILKLKEVKGQLDLLCPKPELQQLADGIQDNGNILEPLEELRETIFGYQMERQTKAYERGCSQMSPDEATVLDKFDSSCCAEGAEFWHGDRGGCLKGTRLAVLSKIELWIESPTTPPVYWLNGLAGTGKSTITQTIAERMFADGQLGASFFCSRGVTKRSDLRFIFPTLAVQLARKYSDFRSLFVPLLRSNPGISHKSLNDQMCKLIVQPLKESKISTVIIIDALDECTDREPASAILSVLGDFVSDIPAVKFFVTSRPELRILEGFRHPSLENEKDVLVLHEVEPNQVADDMLLYFSYELSDIVRRRRGLDGWPTAEQLDVLCKRAAGLFAYAVATVKFIDKTSANPRKQLDLLLQSPERSEREANTKFNEHTTLDSLYTTILRGAFGEDEDPDNDPRVRRVLGAMVLAANPLSPSTIGQLLGLDPLEDVLPLLSSVRSLLILKENINLPALPFHKSFPDFIVDSERCTDKRFHVSRPARNSELLVSCLDLMNLTLKKNMCKLPDAVANSDVEDLKERVERYIDPALQYACGSWHTHLIDGPAVLVRTSKFASALHLFLETKFLFWLEVLSVLGAARNAVDALRAVVDRLEESPALDLVNDCSRFVTSFFEIIEASSPHIYHSALMLTPKTSMVRTLYQSYDQPFARVVCGAPTSWDPTTATTSFSFEIKQAVWSPCNKFIAIGSRDSLRVDILDSTTLQRLQSLETSQIAIGGPMALTFSPDMRLLICLAISSLIGYSSPKGISRGGNRVIRFTEISEVLVLSWDLQTGGVVSTFNRRVKRLPTWEPGSMRIACSRDGKMVGLLHQNEQETSISIYNNVSGSYMHDAYCGTKHFYDIWTHEESLRIATAESMTITICEVGFAPGATCTEVETASIPEYVIRGTNFESGGFGYLQQIQFLPASGRLALVYLNPTPGVLIWGIQDSKYLFYDLGIEFDPPMTFSSDGRFFACSTRGARVPIWRESSTRHEYYATLPTTTPFSSLHLSPNGESIITVSTSAIQLWPTKNFITTSPEPDISTPVSRHIKKFLLDFHPDKSLAVVIRRNDNVAKVLNLESGAPQLTIETGIPVYGLRVIGDTVIVISNAAAITWNLSEGNVSLHGRMTAEDRARVIEFDYDGDSYSSLYYPNFLPDSDGPITAASISSDFRYISVIREGISPRLRLYDTSTERRRPGTSTVDGKGPLWFNPGGNICCTLREGGSRGATIPQDGLLEDPEDLENMVATPVGDIKEISWVRPWWESGGYQVTKDGWVCGMGGKRLLMLPPPWRSSMEDQVWNGRFLALVHGTLPEPVILELEP